MNKKLEIMDKITEVEIKLNHIAFTWLYKRSINPDLFNDLLEVGDEINEIRKEIKKEWQKWPKKKLH